MEKIAMLSCRKLAQGCTMISCLAALREGRGRYSGHAGAEIAAVLDCGGCQDVYNPESMTKNLKRLQEEGICSVALTWCLKPSCACWERITGDLAANGLKIVSAPN